MGPTSGTSIKVYDNGKARERSLDRYYFVTRWGGSNLAIYLAVDRYFDASSLQARYL
jgi:hypothetical protein